MQDFQAQIEELKKASPLSIPSKLIDIEFHDQETAFELYDKISAKFAKEDLMDNVVNPSICTVIDGVLAMPCFKGINRKMGLSAQRVMNECKSFNYDGRMSFLMPDSQVESRNYVELAEKWKEEHRSEYDRHQYENTPAMNRYKQQRIQDNGGRVNMEDEYRMTCDISGSRAGADQRRNDPKYNYVAETDHIIPLKTIFTQLQSNSGLSDEDIRRIANRDYNFAVTGRLVNNPKRDMSNSEFIAKQDELKAAGKPYVELSPEQRANMIRMEQEAQKAVDDNVNTFVLNNLRGKGYADLTDLKTAIANKREELGRELTREESQEVKRKCALDKTIGIYEDVGTKAAKQGLMYALGNAMLLVIKPLYYELKDGFTNGFAAGVYAGSIKEAFNIRFARIRDYVWEQLSNIKNYLGGFLDFLKNFISSIIESLLNMFVGLFKQILRVAKEGVKIVMQSFSVLFGEHSKSMSSNEKGDAIVKIIGGSIVALCGIALDTALTKFPDGIRPVVSSLLTGLAGILVFYALDKADLFNAKADRRNQRIREIFDLRIQDVRDKTEIATAAACEAARDSRIKLMKLFEGITNASENNDYAALNASVSGLYQLLLEKNIEIPSEDNKWDC